MCSLAWEPVQLLYSIFLILEDSFNDADLLARKILTLQLFSDESTQQNWKRSVKDIDGEILCGNTSDSTTEL